MRMTSEDPGLRGGDQVNSRWLAANGEAIRWDSVAAREAIARVCQQAALQCQGVVARYASGRVREEGECNRPGEHRHS
jgi:hypothetical protein